MPRGSKSRLEAFAQAIAAGHTPIKAAEVAGYPKGSSFKANAKKRAQRADVRAMVMSLRQPHLDKVNEAIAVTVEWATKHLRRIVESAARNEDQPSHSDARSSIELLARMNGWLAPEKREVTGKGGVPLLDLTKLTDEQLAILEQIYVAAGLDLGADAESGTPASEDQAKPH